MTEQIDLLTKFDKVQVEAESRLSPEDAAFCKAEQAAYDRAYALYAPFRSSLAEAVKLEKEENETRADRDRSGYNTYCENYGDGGLDSVDKRIAGLQGSFTHSLVHYFEKKYDVVLDADVVNSNLGLKKPESDWRISNTVREKLEEEYRVKSSRNLHFNEIVDEVILQLDGLSFADKVVQQIKDDALNSAFNSYHGKSAYYTVDKKAIRFNDGFTRLRENHRNILRAIWHFNTGATSVGTYWREKLDRYHSYGDDSRVGSPYEFEGLKACKLRYYKSGRWDITFSSAENADTFARVYLGY